MKALMERLLPWQLQYGIDGAKALGHPIVTVYLYKGADGLMSDEQYEEFYWPTLKRLLLGLVDEGLLVWVFTQGKYDSAPAPLQGAPAGTCLIHLESAPTPSLRRKCWRARSASRATCPARCWPRGPSTRSNPTAASSPMSAARVAAS